VFVILEVVTLRWQGVKPVTSWWCVWCCDYYTTVTHNLILLS